ncbi:hypothetical protein FFI89_017715 [Bradyrhizobium sp. KBS0727]|uniref:hypothetical protein n=1 Tax=unclassified Bradyrhizobium TaxID=2631580 RepID=UPI00110E1595|nr:MULTISPECIES: hypothetical protein [unclassified Bradyrhizobium]QDW38822.1 hypothetical protein FFI71_017715 [Bradyrhizobium sp. KBS0725]QDW45425.1 hypothetical protein FFI89_017715 [Bradyrhizobium sp. KBS0727]
MWLGSREAIIWCFPALERIASNSVGVQAGISSSSNQSITYVGLRDIACAGGGTFTATNSQNLGNNSGITITGPAGGGGSSGIIGS